MKRSLEPTLASLDVRRIDHPLGVVLALGGELDIASVPVLEERLDPAIRGRATVVIDLSRLEFIDSTGLRMLLRAERQLRDSGGRLVLVRGPRAVHGVFEVTGLESQFEFCDSVDAASRTAVARRVEPPEPTPTDRPPADLGGDLRSVTRS